jgi:outer membrane protein
MKKSIQTLVTAAIFGALSLAARAEPAVKLLVVDMAKLYDSHYRTIENNAKLQSDDQKAQEEVGKMNKEGQDLVDQYKALNDKSSNPALTADAKASAQNEAQKIFEGIQNKQREVQAFIQNTRNALQQRMQTYKALILEEISKAATEVAKRKGATLLVDKSGPSLFQIPSVIYSDAGFDITDDVMKEINKDRPPTAMQGPATTPAAAPAAPVVAPAAGSSAVNLPGLTPPPKKN